MLTSCQCDAARPACSYCVDRKITCQYDTNQGETPSQALKRKFNELRSLEESNARVIAGLRERPEAEALAILRRLRGAEDVRSLARHIEHGDLLLQVALAPETNYRYDFPFHWAMPAFS